MKLKKIMTVILLAVIMLSEFSFIQFNNTVEAVSESNEETNVQKEINAKTFHYDQLDEVSKKIYDGMVKMKNNGILATGTERYDLVANGHFTSDEVKSYENGTINLKKAFYAARYAFYADNPEVFYVDFSKLSIRTTKGTDGYHVYIGAGNNANYVIEGLNIDQDIEENEDGVNKLTEIEIAIGAFEQKVDEIVGEAENLQIEAGKNPVKEKIKYVHNKITKMTGYRLETDCTPGNEAIISTPYGALVKGQAVCEGYARAVKTVLDRMDIPCILVQGLHQSPDGSAVPHMWNYVQIPTETTSRMVEKKWYAVDATLDDPYSRKIKVPGEDYSDREPGWDIVEGFEHTAYLLVGKETMTAGHIAVEEIEAAGNYKFEYPELEMEDLGINAVTEVNGLVVKYKQEGMSTEEYQGGDFFISYNGMGHIRAREQGYYIVVKYYEYRPGDKEWVEGNWAYFNEDSYAGGFIDRGDYTYLTVPNGEYMEFGVTKTEPTGNSVEQLTFRGTPEIAQTGKLYNPSGTFRAKPFIKKRNIPATASLSVGKTYHMVIEYDDTLLLEKDATEVGYKFESTGPTGAECAKVENLTWDGNRTIEFDFTPSKMFADDGASYAIYPTGLVGKNSGKAPMEITYGAINNILCAFRMNNARNWELFARPTLLENEDLSLNGWQTEDGEAVADKLKNRIALVTTTTTLKEKEEMNSLMEGELEGAEKILKSETYNLSLNACKKYVIKTGHRVRLSVGFPAGYGPEDAGVTFKAYHFIKDANGNVTKVEEIPCIVTQYGLIITCDSFSPFAIAAIEGEEVTSTTKQLVISSAANGVITAVDENENKKLKENGNILDIEENTSKTFKITANKGYEIENVTVCGKTLENTGKYSMNITVNYDDVKDGNPIIDATFVAETVVQEEAENGEEVVIPKAAPIEIKMENSEIVTTINESLVIAPTVTGEPSSQTYQWYKNGVKLEGKTDKVLEIENTTIENEGAYTLKVKSVVGISTEEVTSQACNVVVKTFDTKITAVDSSIDLQDLKPGQTFDINISIENLHNITNGLYAISGKLEYSQDILEIVKNENGNIITAADGWDSIKENQDILEFVTTGGNDSEGIGASVIGTIKLKVKDNLVENAEAEFKLTEITASDTKDDINSNDAQLKMNVVIPEPDWITSDNYEINNEGKIISKVPVNTTVGEFKQNVKSHGDLVFTDNEGKALGDTELIGTGTTIKVGSTLDYTFIVCADTDGNGKVTVTDLAQIKLHLIKKEPLVGVYEKAADLDGNGRITVTDVAQIKLIIVNAQPKEQ